MADANIVAELIDLLPSGAEISGVPWDTSRISELLDQGSTVNKVMSRFWNAKAAESATMIDVSESGSSRSLSTIHENAVRMARYWDDRVKADDDAALLAESGRGRINFHRARRV